MASMNTDTVEPQSNVEIIAPIRQTSAVVFASPHSGRNYPAAFIRQSRLDRLNLRRSEDAFIDEAFIAAPDFGAPLLRAHFPRAYVDANRSPWELDPSMFSDPLPDYVTTQSPRIAAGLGTIPKIVANGEPIYAGKLSFKQALQRMQQHYLPYHHALRKLVSDTQEQFGGCLLVDCHSMPSLGNRQGQKLADIIIGDGHGNACAKEIIDHVMSLFRSFGYTVALNKPYAGGYTTRHYGQPKAGLHTFQIEINRALYMDEKKIERGPGLANLIRNVRQLIDALTSIDANALAATQDPHLKAAE